MKTIDLNGTWEFKAINKYGSIPKASRSVTRWMKATVPGTVHTDLIANGKIPDPFYRMNELSVQWVDSLQWMYRRKFRVPGDLFGEEVVYLLAEGLDTYAQIRLNGKVVAKAANMFVPHEFEVKKYLRIGQNQIEILFDSPAIRSKAIERNHGKLEVSSESHRVYVRKAQYSFGWDWGPKLTTSGIWRDISLRAFSHGRLKDPFIKVISLDKKQAIVGVSVDVERYSEAPVVLRTFIAGGHCSLEHEVQVRTSRVRFQVRIPFPELWWPNGYGGQPLYTALFSLMSGGKDLHQSEIQFALRTVRLLQEEDNEGKSFVFEINGVKIYCKGTDWIPCDIFIPRIPGSTYETLLQLAKDAHMNMIRVWGGGIYEQDAFYELCDKFGLMVWQDFMYACGEYPEQQWFLKYAEEEAGIIVKRLRNHPSIVLWCGNNECEWLYSTKHPEKTPDDMNGAKIFRYILPSVCKRIDGTRPYWRSSPFGAGFPNAESNGNHHQWDVWSFWRDYKEYARDKGRFVAEFGFQAPANKETYAGVTLPEDRHPQSPVVEYHNKQVDGNERLLHFQFAHYSIAESFEGFIYNGQLLQAESLKFAVEHWRRRKFKTAGSLFWQLNDCWPVSSWSVIDSALRPKAAYYFAKRFFLPLLVTFKETKNGIEVWITNDLLTVVKGELVVSLRSFNGKKIWSRSLRVILSPNSSKRMLRARHDTYAGYNQATHYLYAGLWIDGSLMTENRIFFAEPKHLQLPKTKVYTRLAAGKNNDWVLKIAAKKFVKNFKVEIDGRNVLFDDNYFDMDAGTSKEVRFAAPGEKKNIVKRLRLRWL